MRKYGSVFFAAVLIVALLCGCERKPIAGNVTALDDGVLTVQTEQGKNYDFIVHPGETTIFNIVGESGEAFLEEAKDHRVQVTYAKKDGELVAESIFVDAKLNRSAMRLSDGTPVDIWDYVGRKEYCLEDGTILLVEDNTGGPENMHPWNELVYNEAFPEQAQKGIMEYYQAMGLRYDIPMLLEEAYLIYGLVEEYNTQLVSQYIGIEAYNEKIICCQTSLTIPQEKTNGYADFFCEGAVFDRKTGEYISNYDLFRCTPEQLEDYLLDQLDQDGTLNRKNIALNLKPEQIVLCQDGDIEFYLVDRVENGVQGMLQISLSSKQAREILQPWAWVGLPEKFD